MSSRLFTEIREKEGLCYSVWASYQTIKDRGSVSATPAPPTHQAQETLDMLLARIAAAAGGDRDGGSRARPRRA